jgi:hypothetical protein
MMPDIYAPVLAAIAYAGPLNVRLQQHPGTKPAFERRSRTLGQHGVLFLDEFTSSATTRSRACVSRSRTCACSTARRAWTIRARSGSSSSFEVCGYGRCRRLRRVFRWCQKA